MYSDFPIQKATAVADLVKPGEHMSGRAVHQYLKAYANHFGIHQRVRFNCKVETVEYVEEARAGEGKVWTIQCTTAAAGEAAHAGREGCIWTTRKFILATGLTSQPRVPIFDGQGSFGAALFHVKEFAHHQNTLFANKPGGGDQGENTGDDCTAPIAILGGGKSAWDAVYTCASQGHEVNWIIRASGAGPSWMTPAAVFSPLNLLLESLPLVRALGVLSPCIWVSNPIRRFLHGTWLGQMIVRLFWASLEWDMLRTNRYKDHEETAKLRPSYKMIWAGTAVAILNFPGDFFGLVRRGLVKVHIADVERLERNTVVLSNQERLAARGLVLCTGWKASPGIRFLPDGIEQDLGFPWAANLVDQQDLVEYTRQELYTRLPMLQTAPARRMYRAKDAQGQYIDEIVLRPFRLARFMVPPELWDDHSIAILGTVATFNTPLVAEVQALWALVYLNHAPELSRHHLQDKKSALREATLHSEFVALRSPTNHGSRNADFVFEVLPYLDMLLRDLGLRTARKGSWWRNLFVPHQPRDYAGLVEEWKGQARRKIKAA